MRRSSRLSALLLAGAGGLWPCVAVAQALEGKVGTGLVTLDAWDWLNLVLRLVAVVAVIWAAFWALRWYNRRIVTGYGASRALQVLETRALGPNRSMQLVRVGRRAVLVGVTAERINSLLEIDDPEEIERLTAAAAADQGASPAINRLGDLLSRFVRLAREAGAARRTRSTRRSSSGGTGRSDAGAPAAGVPAAQQLQASAAYRSVRIVELQRAIEDARRGTSLEQAR